MTAKEQKLEPLEQIKRLMVLALIHQGVQGKDIATTLGVDPAAVSRMIPARQIRRK